MNSFDILGIVGYTCFCLLVIVCFILALRKLIYSHPYTFNPYDIDKDKKYIVNIDVGDMPKSEIALIVTRLKEIFDRVNLKKQIVGYVPTHGSVGTTALIPFHEFKIPLWQFVERFVGHNSVVYIYKERYYKDEEGVRQHELILLEKVMEWQIDNNPADDGYFEAHPDVKKSKYINNNVTKTFNCFDEPLHERVDAVAVVVDVEEE